LRALAIAAIACGCSGATPDLGYGSELVVEGAQFRPGDFPASTGGPPTVTFVQTHTGVVIGQVREIIHAVFDGSATGAILGIEGTPGSWIVVTQPPDVDTPGEATITRTIGTDPNMPPGPFTLLVSATDSDGRIGEPATLDYIANETMPPSGDLVVSLVWSTTADLDLHVVDPLGNEAWSGKPSTYTAPAPGDPADPTAYLSSGWLDHDGNQGCVLDGDPSEHVIWTTRMGPDGPVAPVIPSGTYTVRVDTRSMCEDPSTSWYVEADSEGALVGAARGLSTPDDTLAPHGNGAGVTAMTFEIP
jgi:hypothetical protein